MTTPGNSIWEQELHASVDAILGDHLRNLQGRVELRLRQTVHEVMDAALRETVPQLSQGIGGRLDQWNARTARTRAAHADQWPEWLSLLLAAKRPAEALQALLYAVSSVAGRAAIFILKSGQANVWRASAGMRLPETVMVREYELLRRCVEQPQRICWGPSAPPADPLPAGLGNALSGGFHPLRVHAKTIGFLYWEHDEATDNTNPQRFELLAQLTGMVLQTLTPAMARPSAAVAPGPAAAPAPAFSEAAAGPMPLAAAAASAPAHETETAPESRRSVAAAASLPQLAPSMTPLEARAHRFAKVLIQDLEIYLHRDRPGALAAARQQRDIYGQLREELERARKSFWEKFPPSSGIGAEILEQAVIRLLCDGDPDLLGPDYPGLNPVS